MLLSSVPVAALIALSVGVVAAVALLAHVVARRRTAAVADGRLLVLSMPPEWALDLAAAQFGVSDWVPVPGDGTINRAHVRPGRPAVSVEAVPGEFGGSEVHIWMSGWTMRGGVVRHAGVARAQMAALVKVLQAADRSYDGPVSGRAGSLR